MLTAMESTSSGAEALSEQLLFSTKQSTSNTIGNNILSKIIWRCKEEMEKDRLEKPLNDYVERVAHYTGLSKMIINQAIMDLDEIEPNRKYFQLLDRIEIFQDIANLYSRKEIPTFKNIFKLFKKPKRLIKFAQFQYMMTCMGFQYRKTELGKEILIEDPTLTFKRFLYLKQINNFREKFAPIYYIDEIFFDSTYTFLKPQLIRNTNIDISSPGLNGYVFFHAVSKQGFLNGLFCSPATKADFVKWVSHILVPMLPGPSVIVIDNNDLHGSLIDNITKYHSKHDMLQYLRQRNIPCNESLHKAELYELIRKCTVKHVSYDVDEILKSHGHTVLRLPENFHDLSITHFLWNYFVDSEPEFFLNVPLSQLKLVLLGRLSTLPQGLWDTFYEAVLMAEDQLLTIDTKACEALDRNFKIS